MPGLKKRTLHFNGQLLFILQPLRFSGSSAFLLPLSAKSTFACQTHEFIAALQALYTDRRSVNQRLPLYVPLCNLMKINIKPIRVRKFLRRHSRRYQYSENPQVDVVIFVQPRSVDLKSVTGEKENHVVGQCHKCRSYESRQQQPVNIQKCRGQIMIANTTHAGVYHVLNRAPHLLSVKQKQPRSVQANIDDSRDMKSIGEHRRRGVHPVISAPVETEDNSVKFWP